MSDLKTEISRKLQSCRELLEREKLDAFRLRGVDWFSWITGGASSVVILTNECGVAEVLVTRDSAAILTSAIEEPRMREESLSGRESLELVSFSWAEPRQREDWIGSRLPKNARVASDRPAAGEIPLPAALLRAKRRMSEDEIKRYRELGKEASFAMTAALRLARPEMSEFEVAALGAQSLLQRGIDPTLVLVGGADRVARYRHPVATRQRIGAQALMVFCGRREGLYACLSRFVFFKEPSPEIREGFRSLAAIEGAAFKLSRPGRQLSGIYQELAGAYSQAGKPHEILKHHQGGLTGYLSREVVARPDTHDTLEAGNVVAWNPSLPGLKMEDTALVTETGLEILTADPDWPTFEHEGVLRPGPLVLG
jgi:Xaa-Pro aminopeptidase